MQLLRMRASAARIMVNFMFRSSDAIYMFRNYFLGPYQRKLQHGSLRAVQFHQLRVFKFG